MVEQCLEALDWDGGEGRRLRKLTTARLDLTAWEEEERADMWGPHDSDREESGATVECTSPKGNRLSANAPRPLGSAGLSGETAAYESR
jgi:hypothetical protein